MARFHMALSHPSWARTCAWLPRLGISAGKEASSKSASSPDGASRSFLPTAMCSTPITASPVRRKTGYFKRGFGGGGGGGVGGSGTPRRERDRKLSSLKPSRGELEVCDLQVRNIRTNDLGRKVYVVVKLCVEFPSPDTIGETQMHVETVRKTTLAVDANKADYPYTYPKPGECGSRGVPCDLPASRSPLLARRLPLRVR